MASVFINGVGLVGGNPNQAWRPLLIQRAAVDFDTPTRPLPSDAPAS